jgi:hypothetical protein
MTSQFPPVLRPLSLTVIKGGKAGGLVKTPITEIVASFTTVSQWTNLVAVQLAEDVERKLATSETARREAANDKSVSAGVKAAVADCDQGRQG